MTCSAHAQTNTPQTVVLGHDHTLATLRLSAPHWPPSIFQPRPTSTCRSLDLGEAHTYTHTEWLNGTHPNAMHEQGLRSPTAASPRHGGASVRACPTPNQPFTVFTPALLSRWHSPPPSPTAKSSICDITTAWKRHQWRLCKWLHIHVTSHPHPHTWPECSLCHLLQLLLDCIPHSTQAGAGQAPV